jgi:hypothetical protein
MRVFRLCVPRTKVYFRTKDNPYYFREIGYEVPSRHIKNLKTRVHAAVTVVQAQDMKERSREFCAATDVFLENDSATFQRLS